MGAGWREGAAPHTGGRLSLCLRVTLPWALSEAPASQPGAGRGPPTAGPGADGQVLGTVEGQSSGDPALANPHPMTRGGLVLRVC